MHSVRRVRSTAEAQALKKKREAGKIVDYKKQVEKVLLERSKANHTAEALQLTTSLLRLNPEYYTIWNYRREILSLGLFVGIEDEEIQSIIDKELTFLFDCLREHPKCYWIWNHRQWCLNTAAKPSWKLELGLVTKMLEYDARNFHGWWYRRYVVQSMETATGISMTRKEFDYTTSKINANFSNFSAWHNRTKLIPRLLIEEPDIDARDFLGKEIYFITQAMYTDPDDQSVWLYHRWLVTSNDIVNLEPIERKALLGKEIKSIEELLEVEPDSKWCLHSLAFYKTYLANLLQEQVDLTVEGYLDKLEKIDSMRRHRYQDWKKEIADR
ncbi:hypothetical protein V1512DRAFT_218412 [Lipomyces arxii]|uniref:uncharacterized protein n=1 Tax=Lipomyces arxii TaxID=56418 RepID=UPI0034CF8633